MTVLIRRGLLGHRRVVAVLASVAVFAGSASAAYACGGWRANVWQNWSYVAFMHNTYGGQITIEQSEGEAATYNNGCTNIYIPGVEFVSGSFICAPAGQGATLTDLAEPSAEPVTWNDSYNAQKMWGWEYVFGCVV